MILRVLIILLALGGLAGVYVKARLRTVYVNQAELFGQFRLKKVLETEYQNVEHMRRQQLDSLVLSVRMAGKQAHTARELRYLELLKENLLAKEEEFARMNEQLRNQYNEQIWNQLNQYIKDYAGEHGIDYVLGNAGDGAVMFAAPVHDKTKEIITYVNARFEGKAQ